MNVETANRLQMLRKKNNLSQEELAEKIGISRQAVSKWERAEASPDTDNLILLAKLYGVTLDDLLKTESVHFPDEDSISLRKEDYINSPADDDGEIYPNARPFEYKASEEPAQEKKASHQQTSQTASPNDVGEFVKNLAEFTVNVSKEAIGATSKAMKEANADIKNGKSTASAIGDSFEKHFEKFGENVENIGESFGKSVEDQFKDMDREFKDIDRQFQYSDSFKKKDKKEKSIPKKHPASLLDKLFPIIVVFFFVVFCSIGLAHPMWMIFLFIPVYYILSNAYKKYRAGEIRFQQAVLQIFDGIVPFGAVWLFFSFGELFHMYEYSWMVFLLIPIYYIFSASAKKFLSGVLSPLGAVIFFLNGSLPIMVVLLFFFLGFLFSFSFSWIVFFIIPVYYITADHIKKNAK